MRMKYASTIIALTQLIAKPIKLDTQRIKNLAKTLNDMVKKKITDPSDTLGNRTLIRDYPFDIENVTGKEEMIFIRVNSKHTDSKDYVVDGGFGTTNGRKLILINLNGSINSGRILEAAGDLKILENAIYLILAHELTHAADWLRPVTVTHEEVPHPDDMDLHEYYNDPNEIRAYTRQLIEELDQKPANWYEKIKKHFGSYKGLTMLVNLTDTWQLINPHLTEKNRTKILKDVWSHVTSLNTEG